MRSGIKKITPTKSMPNNSRQNAEIEKSASPTVFSKDRIMTASSIAWLANKSIGPVLQVQTR